MRKNVSIPSETHEKLRLHAFKTRKSIAKILAELVSKLPKV